MIRRSMLVAAAVVFTAGFGGSRGPQAGLANGPSRRALPARPALEPKLVGRWEYQSGTGTTQIQAHLDLRADGTFEYVAIDMLEVKIAGTDTRYALGFRYRGSYKATAPSTVLFSRIGKAHVEEYSHFDNFAERVAALDTGGDSARDREYRWTLNRAGDAVTFVATDGGTDQSEDLNTLMSGPFHKKK